jgi:hypothetical protein
MPATKRLAVLFAIVGALAIGVPAYANKSIQVAGSTSCAANCVETLRLRDKIVFLARDSSGTIFDVKTAELPIGARQTGAPTTTTSSGQPIGSSLSSASSGGYTTVSITEYETLTERVTVVTTMFYNSLGQLVGVEVAVYRRPKAINQN